MYGWYSWQLCVAARVRRIIIIIIYFIHTWHLWEHRPWNPSIYQRDQVFIWDLVFVGNFMVNQSFNVLCKNKKNKIKIKVSKNRSLIQDIWLTDSSMVSLMLSKLQELWMKLYEILNKSSSIDLFYLYSVVISVSIN